MLKQVQHDVVLTNRELLRRTTQNRNPGPRTNPREVAMSIPAFPEWRELPGRGIP